MKPLVSWTGGKTRLLPAIHELIGAERVINNYFEPCMGGGALFFDIHERITGRSYLNDINHDLIRMYGSVRDEPENVLDGLRLLSTQDYTVIRARFNSGGHEMGTWWQAANVLALLHLGFNSLWRVNKSGHFNVPIGRGSKSDLFPEGKPKSLDNFNWDAIAEASEALQGSDLMHLPLSQVWDDYTWRLGVKPGPGDLVFYDPPYTNTFSNYHKSGFGPKEHEELVTQAKRSAERGALVICCGSNDEATQAIYGIPTRVVGIERTNGASKRKRVMEAFYVYGS